MQPRSPRTNWIIDAVLFAGFILTFLLDITGLALHQWLGIGVGLLAAYHLIVHWRWVKSVTRRLGSCSGQTRTYYLLDALLLAGMALTVLNGLVLSTWFSLPLDDYLAWRAFHVIVSIATLLLVVLKIALHWRWIASVARRHILRPVTPMTPALQPASVPVKAQGTVDRREFLRLMSVVGVGAMLAIGSALNDELAALARGPVAEPESMIAGVDASESPAADTVTAVATPVAQVTVLPSPTPQSSAAQTSATSVVVSTPLPTPTLASSPTAASSTCVVRCNVGCSYPGRCRRYTDQNKNNRCDLGECL